MGFQYQCQGNGSDYISIGHTSLFLVDQIISSIIEILASLITVIMYRTTGYTLSTLNKNVTGLILDYLAAIEVIKLSTCTRSLK
jgi:hypothetical protein